MYVSVGVGGVATILPVVEPRVQLHYFLDSSSMYYYLNLSDELWTDKCVCELETDIFTSYII